MENSVKLCGEMHAATMWQLIFGEQFSTTGSSFLACAMDRQGTHAFRTLGPVARIRVRK